MTLFKVSGGVACTECGREWPKWAHRNQTPRLTEPCPSDDCPTHDGHGNECDICHEARS